MLNRVALLLGFSLFAGLLVGCERPDEIGHYQQTKPDALLKTYFGETASAAAPATATNTHRMLAAIVPHQSQFWFFKLVGPTDAATELSEPFAKFLTTVHFADAESPPEWTLPKDWRQQPASGGRFATIQIPRGESHLELSVTSLPKRPGDDIEAILMNVNCWRNQMSLRPIAKDQLAATVHEISLADGKAYVVALVGRLQSGGMTGAPLAGGVKPELPAGHPPVERSAEPSDARPLPNTALPSTALPNAALPNTTASPDELKYEIPSGWQPGKAGAMRKAAFAVQDGARGVEITVVALGPRAADIVANVNRWRGQLKLPEADAKEIAATVKLIPLGDVTGSYVQILGSKNDGPQQAIFGVIAPRGDMVWSVALRGDAELAEREKPRFEEFVKSIRFDSVRFDGAK